MLDPEIYGDSWYVTSAVAAPQRARLNFDLDVDVCVVGGGLAGLTAAYEVARRGWSVVVLEAQRIGWAASGRNCGVVAPGFAQNLEAIVARVGAETARTLWALSVEGVDYVRTAAAGMPGVEPVEGWLDIGLPDEPGALAERLRLLDMIGAECSYWPTPRLRAVLRSARFRHAVHFPRAFSLHPLNYTLGLARAAETAGVRIFEGSPAMSIDPAGVRKRITTPSARVRANHVVLAGNVRLDGLLPRLGATIMPVNGYVAVTEPLGGAIGEAMEFSGAAGRGNGLGHHHRIVDGDRLLWGGGASVWAGNPRRRQGAIARAIARTYPQLGRVAIDFVWRATLGRTVHGMPQIGELQPGLWVASGFGGHGLDTTALAGVLVARGIVEGNAGWREFRGYELIWAGGVAGRAAVQFAYWARGAAAWLAEARLRRNEGRTASADAAAAVTPETAPIKAGGSPAAASAPAGTQAERGDDAVPRPQEVC